MITEKIYLKDRYAFLGENGKNPTVDMYLPYNLTEMGRQNEKRPSIVVCPGGAYAGLSGREAEPIALKFLDMGFNVFVLYYSVAPNRYPTQIIEVAALFDLINKNAQKYNCDTEKIGIIGFSAGGHLAAHYSNLWNDDILKKYFENSYSPAASILCYPVISTRNAHRGSFENLIGHFPETEDEISRFSCEKLVSKQTPPTFLFHTAPDSVVPVENSLYYAEALSKNKIPFELHIYPFGNHGAATSDGMTFNEVTSNVLYTSDWVLRVKRWLNNLFDMNIGGM